MYQIVESAKKREILQKHFNQTYTVLHINEFPKLEFMQAIARFWFYFELMGRNRFPFYRQVF